MSRPRQDDTPLIDIMPNNHAAKRIDVNGIVQVKAQHLPLRLHNTNHSKTRATDAYKFPQRTAAREKLLFYPAAQHNKSARRPRIIIG